MSFQRAALKQAITQIVSCALEPVSEIQRLTEERKKALEMTEDYPFILIEIINSPEALPERIMATTLLKNYVIGVQKGERKAVGLKVNWEKRLALSALDLLRNENNVIRELIATTLNILIMEFNYDNFELMNTINNKVITYLLSENRHELEGAVKLMHEMACSRKDEPKYPYFSPEYIEPLLNVLHNESYSVALRSSTIACMVEIWRSSKGDEQVFSTTHNRIVEVFENLLRQPYNPNTNNFKMKADVISGIIISLVRLGEHAVQLVTRCLQPIGEIYSNCCQEIKAILMGVKEVPRDDDENAEPQNFSRLLLVILELIENILHVPSCLSLLTPCLNDFVYLLFFLMCSVDDEECAIFIESNVDDLPKDLWSVRAEASLALMDFVGKFDLNMFITAVHASIQKHVTEANEARPTSEMYYLRVFESLMYGLGVLRANLDNALQDFLVYVEQWSTILQNHQQVNWFVLGRLLWLGAKFSSQLSINSLNYHISAVVAYYKCDNESLRIACVGSLKHHLKFAKNNNNNRLVISNHLNEITECLFSVNLDTDQLAIESFQSFTYFFEHIADATIDNNIQRVLQAIIYVLHAHFSNINVIIKINVLLRAVIRLGNKNLIKQHFIPFCFELVYKEYVPLQTKSDSIERGLDLLNTVVKFSPGEIDDDVVLNCFEAAYKNITAFEDVSHAEIATILLSNLIMKVPYKIKGLTDRKGKTLAEYVPDIISKLLDTTQEQYCPSKLGRLTVISFMCLTENFQPYMEPILKSLITFLQRAKQVVSLINCYLIFSYMFSWQTVNIMNFLSNIPGPDGKCALSFFLNKWTFDLLYTETFEKRIIAMGICKMIEFSISNHDNRIDDCSVYLERYYETETCTGLEKLYLLLIKLFLIEITHDDCMKDNSFADEDNTDDELIKNHPIYNINLADHIKTFIRNFNTIHYYNVFEKYVKKTEPNADELEKHGIQPRVQITFNE